MSYTSSSWSLNNYSLNLGDNSLTIYGQNSSGNTSPNSVIDINRHELGNIKGSGVVDLTDFSIFALDWLHQGGAISKSFIGYEWMMELLT